MGGKPNTKFFRVEKSFKLNNSSRISDFNKTFEVFVDVSGIGIGVILSQNKHPIDIFGKKLKAPFGSLVRDSFLLLCFKKQKIKEKQLKHIWYTQTISKYL